MDIYEPFTKLPVSKYQFEQFKAGDLWRQWAALYPQLFDADDVRVAESQAARGYHFHEWLAALVIYQSVGYLSLIESYEFKVQKRKQSILHKLLPDHVQEAVVEITSLGKAQCPDLLCFKSDLSDWFFCEVKGPKDASRPIQEECFQHLVRASGKKIKLFEFEYFPEEANSRAL